MIILKNRHPFRIEQEIERENKRVGHEWDSFMTRFPQCWDNLPEDGKKEAINLAEKQGLRLNRVLLHYREAKN